MEPRSTRQVAAGTTYQPYTALPRGAAPPCAEAFVREDYLRCLGDHMQAERAVEAALSPGLGLPAAPASEREMMTDLDILLALA